MDRKGPRLRLKGILGDMDGPVKDCPGLFKENDLAVTVGGTSGVVAIASRFGFLDARVLS